MQMMMVLLYRPTVFYDNYGKCKPKFLKIMRNWSKTLLRQFISECNVERIITRT